MEFLTEYHLLGLVIGIATFLIIGLFHPVVVKAEYYWGTGCWWIFLVLGIGGIAWSLLTDNVLIAALAGRVRVLVVLDDQGTVRTARARPQRLVPGQPETPDETSMPDGRRKTVKTAKSPVSNLNRGLLYYFRRKTVIPPETITAFRVPATCFYKARDRNGSIDCYRPPVPAYRPQRSAESRKCRI